jgi:cell division septum initiation protein DivIVA
MRTLDQVLADFERHETENTALKAENARLREELTSAVKGNPATTSKPASQRQDLTQAAPSSKPQGKSATQVLLESRGVKTVEDLAGQRTNRARTMTGLK